MCVVLIFVGQLHPVCADLCFDLGPSAVADDEKKGADEEDRKASPQLSVICPSLLFD